MVLIALTDEERARHKRAVAKMRQCLFLKHSAQEYRIMPDSERVLAAYAEGVLERGMRDISTRASRGLEYHVDCADPAGASRFAVSHSGGDQFSFWLSAAKGHTLCALTVHFRDLDEVPFRYVASLRRSNVAPVYTGRPQR